MFEIPHDQEARMRQLVAEQSNKWTLATNAQNDETVFTGNGVVVDQNDVCCKKLCKEATIPTKSHILDAGWDLYALEDCLIRRGERETVWTGIAMAIPEGCVGLIWPRSGLAAKRGIDVFAGVIDSGYRGNIGVCLYNSDSVYEVRRGERIAQMIIHRIPPTRMLEVDGLESINCDQPRGNGGFGSSGS
jgi:dUTP pyrophosphatase